MWKIITLIVSGILFSTGCTGSFEIVKEFPINSNDIIDDSLAVFTDNSSDNNGCLKIESEKEMRIYLYEIKEIELTDCLVMYEANLKSNDFQGSAFLEMLCTVNGAEYFSKGLDNTISGTKDWEKHHTVFRFKKGERPTNIKLNLILEGKGEIDIDDIKLMKRNLKKSEI